MFFKSFFSWKDPQCPFRLNAKTQVKGLPTLHRWGTQKKLDGEDILKPDLLEMLLNDEDD